MLSRQSALILGLISEKPMNPYLLIKVLDYLHTRDWCPMAESSVYAAVNSLERKGLVRGEEKREGRMPARTVYSATEAGTASLLETLRLYFSDVHDDPAAFQIACLLVCHLPKDEVRALLASRLGYQRKASEHIEKRIGYLQRAGIPALGTAIVRHNLLLAKAEISVIEDMLAAIDGIPGWDYRVTHMLQ